MEYFIQINLTCEIFDKIPHYFWCIFKRCPDTISNCGHGWAPSAAQAASDALAYYQKISIQ